MKFIVVVVFNFFFVFVCLIFFVVVVVFLNKTVWETAILSHGRVNPERCTNPFLRP